MQHSYGNFAIFIHDTEILVVLGNYTDKELHKFITELTSHLKMLLSNKENFSIGIGKQTKSIRCLYKSYRQAESIQKLQAKNKIDKSLIYYSDMGIFKLFMSIEDEEILHEYYEHTIQPIQDYDKKIILLLQLYYVLI